MAEEGRLAIVRTVAELRSRLAGWRAAGRRIALVPTMGALHAGHLSLVELARRNADAVVASIFVNPRQFAPSEDLDAYPRTEAADGRALASAGCDLMFAPGIADMYPQGFATTLSVGGPAGPLEGVVRPGHFDGVATVVAKLLMQAQPEIAVFGEKDYQQLLVIRRLVRDLDLPVEIIGAPIARDKDGLALSSRNAYLGPAERPIAGRLNLVLSEAVSALRGGAAVDTVETDGRAALARVGFDRVDYLEVRDAETLDHAGPEPVSGPARVLAAAWLGRTRLIDNMPV